MHCCDSHTWNDFVSSRKDFSCLDGVDVPHVCVETGGRVFAQWLATWKSVASKFAPNPMYHEFHQFSSHRNLAILDILRRHRYCLVSISKSVSNGATSASHSTKALARFWVCGSCRCAWTSDPCPCWASPLMEPSLWIASLAWLWASQSFRGLVAGPFLGSRCSRCSYRKPQKGRHVKCYQNWT